jgi:DNA-binding response OmpR family regulator
LTPAPDSSLTIGFPATTTAPYGWNPVRSSVSRLETYDDFLEFLERVGTARPNDVVVQAGMGTTGAFRICRLLKQHTGAAIHVVAERLTQPEISTAAAIGVGSIHDVEDGYAALGRILHERISRARRERTPLEITVANIRIDKGRRRVSVGSNELSLTKTEFEILWALAAQAGEIVSREELTTLVWGENWFGAVNVLDTHLSHLRSKLTRAAGGFSPLNTVRGIGFYLDTQADSRVSMIG